MTILNFQWLPFGCCHDTVRQTVSYKQQTKCKAIQALLHVISLVDWPKHVKIFFFKAPQQATTAATDPTGASGSTAPAPPSPLTWAQAVAGKAVDTPAQAITVLVSEVQKLGSELSQARAFGVKTHDLLRQEQQTNTEHLEHLHRHSKRNNLIVFGIPESSAHSMPAKLACHMQGVLFQAAPATELTLVRSAFRLGKWKQDQHKPRAVLVELLSVAAKHTAFQASSRLRASGIRLDEDLTPAQMKQRRGLSTDFQCLKARGYKPFFRGVVLKYRDGALIRKCDRGEANRVVAAAAQAARATAPAVPRPQPARRASVAMDPTEVLHRAGVSVLGHLSDPLLKHSWQPLLLVRVLWISRTMSSGAKPLAVAVFYLYHIYKFLPASMACLIWTALFSKISFL